MKQITIKGLDLFSDREYFQLWKMTVKGSPKTQKYKNSQICLPSRKWATSLSATAILFLKIIICRERRRSDQEIIISGIFFFKAKHFWEKIGEILQVSEIWLPVG